MVTPTHPHTEATSEPQHITHNAVSLLRHQRLAHSTRPFKARGCRVVRCQSCLLPQHVCLCCYIQPQQHTAALFTLLMYDTEPLKPSNTGRLIADVLPETTAFLWSRTSVSEELLQLLHNPQLQPYVVFPSSYSPAERVVTEPLPKEGQRPLFIMLDGTWTEARKMFRKSPYLNQFPVLSLNLAQFSKYQLREAQHDHQYCTAEIAAALLELAGDKTASQVLNDHFTLFKERYLAAKFNRSVENITA